MRHRVLRVISTHKKTLLLFAFLTFYSVGISLATPPTSAYQPGETLDPQCAPESSAVCTTSFAGSFFAQDGNSFGTTATIGTNDNQPLVFEINGAERMRIDTAGSYILSSPNPTFILDVIGATGAGDNIIFKDNGTYKATVWYDKTLNAFRFGSGSFRSWTVELTTDRMSYGYPLGQSTSVFAINYTPSPSASSVENILNLSTSNTNTLQFKTNGNLLLGTTTDAGYKLDVNGTARVQDSFTATTTSGTHTFTAGSNNLWLDASTLVADFSGGHYFQIAGDNVFVIGTASIVVSKPTLVSYTISHTSGTNTDNMFALQSTINNTGGTNTVRGFYYNPTLTSLTGTTHIAIETVSGDNYFGTTSGSTMIGYTSGGGSPGSYKLDVNGGIRATSITNSGLTSGYVPRVSTGGLMANGSMQDDGTNVGIGTAPVSLLTIKGSDPVLTIADSRNQSFTVGDQLSAIDFASDDTSSGGFTNKVRARIAALEVDTFGASQALAFYTTRIGTGILTENMRLTDFGDVVLSRGSITSPLGPNAGSGFQYITITGSGGSGSGNIQLTSSNTSGSNAQTLGSLEWYNQAASSANSRTAYINVTSSGTAGANIGSYMAFATESDGVAGTATERMRISNNGNLLIGTTTDGGQKLQVSGTSTFSDSITLFSGQTGKRLIFAGSGSQGGIEAQNTSGLRISGYGSGSTTGTTGIFLIGQGDLGGGAWTPTSGTTTIVQVASNNMGNQWAPTSGTATYTALLISPGLNTTGSYSGISRGIYYNPTVTSTTGLTHIAIETVTGDIRFGTTSGAVSIGNTNNTYKLEVGNNSVSGIVARFVNSTGTCDINPTSSSLSCSSDQRLKKNITTLDNTILDKILSLRPVIYNWNAEGDTDPMHDGFIAQEVEAIFPDLVTTDTHTDLKSLNYMGLIPYTIKAIQELHIKVSMLPDLEDQTLGEKVMTFLQGIAERGEAVVDTLRAREICAGQTCVDEIKLQHMIDYINSHPDTGGSSVPAPDQPEDQQSDTGADASSDTPTPDPAPAEQQGEAPQE